MSVAYRVDALDDPRVIKAWAGRFRKAEIIGDIRRVRARGRDRYSVRSASDDRRYFVRVTGDRYDCTCPAGQSGRPCWHVAKVIRYRQANDLDAPPISSELIATPMLWPVSV
ncbi:MAG: SWIM zinc finger family protein [Dehalococcoidia bacterium]